MSGARSAWRVLGGVLTAWFDAPSLAAAAALAERALAGSDAIAVDCRATGLRVRVGSAEQAAEVSAAAADLGLAAHPAVLQQLDVVVESAEPAALQPFWQRVLGYDVGDDGLVDPLRRDPDLRWRATTQAPAGRHRVHLDVVRPAAQVELAALGEAFGPYGVCHADADGNEVDVVPGDPLGGTGATADWQAVFGAVACYRTTSATQQRDLAAAAAALADAAGFPLLVDLRPGLVVLDSGKDCWDAQAHGLDVDFMDLAARLQSTARDLGAVADPTLPRFVQVFLDAADVAAVRAFWSAALGYLPDRREATTDLVDPRRLNPVLLFQELDAADGERLRQRNRVSVEVAVPADAAPARLATALAAGGRLLAQSPGRLHLADPEGNELVIVSES